VVLLVYCLLVMMGDDDDDDEWQLLCFGLFGVLDDDADSIEPDTCGYSSDASVYNGQSTLCTGTVSCFDE
jgi:hypothetical protein